MLNRISSALSRAGSTLSLAAHRFRAIDGGQRAAAFAYSAFFSLFPFILLLVSLSSVIFDRATAGAAIISYIEKYIPLSGELQQYLFDTVLKVSRTRGKAGFLAFAMLTWAAMQFFTTLVHATNRAWGTEIHNWWRQPLKNLTLLGITIIAVLMGVAVPVLGKMARSIFHAAVFFPWAYSLWVFFVPWLVLFLGLIIFYKLAPRRRTTYKEVWLPALCATALLHVAQTIFVLYLKHFSSLTATYGAFGGVIALMLWIYVSGMIFIFCACLCAAQASTKPKGVNN